MSRDIVIGGNWKLNTTLSEGVQLASQVIVSVGEIRSAQVAVFPPATHLARFFELLKSTPIGLGAQNAHWESSGAFTGELSMVTLKQLGCGWLLIGHSERRVYFGETDQTVNRKLLKALEVGLRPIVCIGETLEERESGRTFDVLERQLEVGLRRAELKGRGGVAIAYEPVWAIGTGRTATPAQAQEAHRFIRDVLARLFGREAAEATTVQYGGSMNDANAAELLSQPDVDGGLIGGASLKPDKFAAIVRAAEG